MLRQASSLQTASLRSLRVGILAVRSVTVFAERSKRLERQATVELDASLNYLEKRASRTQLGPLPAHMKSTIEIVQECVAKQDYESGWVAFEQAQGTHAILYGAILNLCAKADWWNRAWAIWEGVPHDQKNVVHYTTMIDFCSKLRRQTAAEGLFQEMQDDSVQANLLTYISLLKTYSMSGNTQKALDTFQSVPAAVFDEAGMKSKQISYQCVMQACARVGDYARTREFFMQMTQAGIGAQIAHYNALLTACASSADAVTADGVLKSMVSAGIEPNLPIYTILISCNQFNMSRCLEIVEEMKLKRIEPSPLTNLELLNAYVIARDGEGARKHLASADFGFWKTRGKYLRLSDQAQTLP